LPRSARGTRAAAGAGGAARRHPDWPNKTRSVAELTTMQKFFAKPSYLQNSRVARAVHAAKARNVWLESPLRMTSGYVRRRGDPATHGVKRVAGRSPTGLARVMHTCKPIHDDVSLAPEPGCEIRSLPVHMDSNALSDSHLPTILLIDDEPDLLIAWALLLELEGFHVLTAFEPHEGVELAQRVHPALVITDLMMPGMDGAEVCRTLKSDPGLDGMPVILWSASTDIPTDLDCECTLHKPVARETLLDQVDLLLGRLHDGARPVRGGDDVSLN
jgi:CheY-like chemotaxis protein